MRINPFPLNIVIRAGRCLPARIFFVIHCQEKVPKKTSSEICNLGFLKGTIGALRAEFRGRNGEVGLCWWQSIGFLAPNLGFGIAKPKV